jgi:hypothetical protein
VVRGIVVRRRRIHLGAHRGDPFTLHQRRGARHVHARTHAERSRRVGDPQSVIACRRHDYPSPPILDRHRKRFGDEVMQQKFGKQVPIGRLGKPDEVGWGIVYLASDESSFMTGSEMIIDGGISAM